MRTPEYAYENQKRAAALLFDDSETARARL